MQEVFEIDFDFSQYCRVTYVGDNIPKYNPIINNSFIYSNIGPDSQILVTFLLEKNMLAGVRHRLPGNAVKKILKLFKFSKLPSD